MSSGPSANQSSDGTCAPAQAGANPAAASPTLPEDAWLPFIREHYPNLQGQAYFFPPARFNRVPYSVEEIAGQMAQVRTNPSPSGAQVRAQTNPLHSGSQSLHPPQTQQAALGTVFTSDPSTLEPLHVQESDMQDDRAQQRCLQSLQDLCSLFPQPFMVLSELRFRKYLDEQTNPMHAAAIAQLPTIHTLRADIANGECDALIISRNHGFVIGEIKSVGDNQHFFTIPENQQDQVIAKMVMKAVKQVNKQAVALRHLVSDLDRIRINDGMDPITIIKTLFLPNITSGQLHQALASCPSSQCYASLPQELCSCVGKADVSQAVSTCLCQDNMSQPSTWWQNAVLSCKPSDLTPTMYERLVARFCGPATTVEVATPFPPRLVIRSLGEAVAETGQRFSRLALTPDQVALLDLNPEPRFVYLQGPPGCGKTVVLVLKALQWIKQGRTLHIISTSEDGRAVSVLMEHQIRCSLGEAAASAQICRLHYKFIECDDFSRAVQDLAALAHSHVGVIMDEIKLSRSVFFKKIIEVCPPASNLCLWAAGLRVQTPPTPARLRVKTMNVPLRCPPTITKQVEKTPLILEGRVPRYSTPDLPVPTEGPPVQFMQHRDEPNHTGNHPLHCHRCGDNIVEILKELRVGEEDCPLQYRDAIVITTSSTHVANVSHSALVRRLDIHHSLPVKVMTTPLTDTEARELALGTTDQVIVTDKESVSGLERRVVIVIGGEIDYNRLLAMSRCTARLYVMGSIS